MDSTRPVHIGRQALYNAEGQVAAYELLFRDGPHAHEATVRDSAATSRVIVEAFTAFGIEELVGDKLCFVNLTREFLVGALPLPFAPGRVGLELLSGIEVDDELVAAAAALTEQGHRLALDGYTGDPAATRLLPHVHFVKVDMQAGDRRAIARIVDTCRRIPRIRLIAQRIETPEQLELATRHRFQLFQGHILSRPHLITTQALNPSRLARVRLVTELAADDVDLDRAVSTIERDPALAVRILRGVNAAANGLKQPVSSIFQAVVLLGIPQVRQWATLMMVADLAEGDETVLTDAVVRARMCQTVAERRGAGAGATAFTVGLLSAIGDLMGGPATTLTDQLPLTRDVAAAIHGQGDLGTVLREVRSYQRGDAADDLHADLLAALSWTNASLAEPEPAAP
ncbi:MULTISPECIES: EAL and HDOD domain-containing protein [Dactylosporangium]|uniref:Histidine kinase n=2 Tax=Dactylosporangium TaxID=35753 RepID=A0A9W6NPY3_9ACTN|nr:MULTISPECIES: HDOD domain-containing protein [Dactylosporangium]UAB93566.1 HDOD domain-containing protein [Dactylosporangium vinaceum]UWZ41951.1 HDOD domain-containing protein [Dactylosporangium matsuzakiense]GLL04979.1 histidine kinase [Dactylosporangium matsuzakiense]